MQNSNFNAPETFTAPGVNEPEMVECQECKGTGELEAEDIPEGDLILCPTCDGTGFVEPEGPDLADVPDWGE